MEFFKMILSYVKKKKWEVIAILVLITILSFFGTLMLRSLPLIIKQTTTDVIKEELAPIKVSIEDLNARVDDMNKGLASLQTGQLISIHNSGVAAYKKFAGLSGDALIQSLETNTQNALATKTALSIPEVREQLRQLDPQLTVELLSYWQIQIS